MRYVAALVLLAATTITAQTRGDRPCSTSLLKCPPRGCAASATPEAGANAIRRAAPHGPARVTLTIDDFEVLQLATDSIFRQGFGIPPRDRTRLEHVAMHEGSRIGERTIARVRAYIVGTPHRRRTDTANCNLLGSANNNIRLHLAADPHDTVYESIIAEVTATTRPKTWTLAKLRKLQREHRLIMVTGQLFYDSKHWVNNDPDADVPQQPARLSLWELHPVTNILVCTSVTNDCPANDTHLWEPLASYD